MYIMPKQLGLFAPEATLRNVPCTSTIPWGKDIPPFHEPTLFKTILPLCHPQAFSKETEFSSSDGTRAEGVARGQPAWVQMSFLWSLTVSSNVF